MEDKITPLITRIAEIKQTLAPLEAQVKPLLDELDEAKFELMSVMLQSKSKRTEAVNGYYVVRAERKTYTVEDKEAVSGWLVANGFDLDEYTKLDATRIKAVAESAVKETGELIPGVHVDAIEYLSVKEEVKK